MFGRCQPYLSERQGIGITPKADEDRAEPITLAEVVPWTEAEHLDDSVTVHSLVEREWMRRKDIRRLFILFILKVHPNEGL